MKEVPILFNTEMVKAILDGRKIQTRRIIRNTPLDLEKGDIGIIKKEDGTVTGYGFENLHCQIGDTLWVRETWADLRGMGFDKPFTYLADCLDKNGVEDADGKRCRLDYGVKWKPSIHMPREACRLFLKVKDVRVEQLQEITEEGAKVEGIVSYWAEPHKDVAPFIGAAKEIGEDLCPTRREAFSQLWDRIYQPQGFGWDVNPWVWVIEFERQG